MSYPIQMNYEPLYQLWPCMRRMPIEWSKPWDSWFLRVRKGRELRCTTFSIPENTDFGYRLYMEVATRPSLDGSVEKISIKNLRVDRCINHVSWWIPIQAEEVNEPLSED